MAKGLSWDLNLIFGEPPWYPAIVPTLLDAVTGAFFWPALAVVGPSVGKHEPLTRASLQAAATSNAFRTWRVASHQSRSADVEFTCGRVHDMLTCSLVLHDNEWTSAGARLARDLEALTWSFIGAFRDHARATTLSGVRPDFDGDLDYVHVSPRLNTTRWREDALMHVIDRREAAAHPENARAEIERVAAAEVPAGVRRRENLDVVVQVWTDELTDERALRDACTRHERWLAELLTPQPATRPFGRPADSVAPLIQRVQAPPLTFACGVSGVGYLAIVVMPDGSVDEARWHAGAAFARAGKLPDGRPLRGVYVIAPLREAAVAIWSRAHGDGFLGAVYPDDSGKLLIPQS